MNGYIDPNPPSKDLMLAIDAQISHIWMVRAFLKHSDEAGEDEELAEIHRGLYDFMLALGPSLEAGDSQRYISLAKKKLGKLRRVAELFGQIQPEVSGHMNFRMAAQSLRLAVECIAQRLGSAAKSKLGNMQDCNESDESDESSADESSPGEFEVS